jgi:Lipocalin-like
MKKILLITLTVFVISSCGKDTQEVKSSGKTDSVSKQNSQPLQDKESNFIFDPDDLLGSWVNKDNKMGFEIKPGGKAASVNMATLDYNSWKLDGDKLILNSTSKGVSNPVTVDEVFIIRELTLNKIIVSPSENPATKWTYDKSNQ